MIKEDERNAVIALYERCKRKSEISKLLKIDRKTVTKIIKNRAYTRRERFDKATVDENLLKEVLKDCQGYVQRTHEVLVEKYNISIAYSTLSRIIREAGLKTKSKNLSDQVPDLPGEEMQHDTSPYKIMIGGKKTKVNCSSLYLRYSKMRYIKFYPFFNRFNMKCFLHEALTHWGYSAKVCIIDNTNLAVFSDSGRRAVFSQEMEVFAHQYGFSWKAHEIRHSNRKAGVERNFFTVETNFFPGRKFSSLEDLNRQAFEWSTVRWKQRPLSKTKLIPGELFELEKPSLIKVSNGISEPYLPHFRTIDQYGYVSFGANFYWTASKVQGNVCIIEYSKKIRICLSRLTKGLVPDVEYRLPPWKTVNQKYFPEGFTKPKHQPNNRKMKSDNEEKYISNLAPVCAEYVNFVFSKKCVLKQKHRFIRDLYRLLKKMSKELCVSILSHALAFHVVEINSIKKIVHQILQDNQYELLSFPDVSDFEKRQSYLDGRFSKEESNPEDLKKLNDPLSDQTQKTDETGDNDNERE